MKNVKIIQIQAMPNDIHYQGCLLGLGDDGVVYVSTSSEKEWSVYQPLEFK